MSHDLIPLSQLPIGRRGTIGAVVGKPDDVHRLEELGMRTGTEVEMLQTGSPCIIRLSGNKLCFRADELLRILVRSEDA